MHAFRSRLLLGALALALVTLAGCSKGKGGTVPVQSPMQTFVAPETDELIPEDETDDAADSDADAGE